MNSTEARARLQSSSRPPLVGTRLTATTRPSAQQQDQNAAGPSPCQDVHDHSGHQSRFYFVVFMNGSAPVFHSNRIPSDLLGDYTARKEAATTREASPAPPPGVSETANTCPCCYSAWARCAGRCGRDLSRPSGLGLSEMLTLASQSLPSVGDFAGNTAGVEEVPQQSLQSIAFPSSFASARTGPSLTRRTPGATRLTTPAPERHPSPGGGLHGATPLQMGHSVSTDSLGPASRDARTAHTPSSSCPTQEPPFSLRIEEVRNTKGELRCCRLVSTANFTTLVSSHTGAMHAMQTRMSAIALVITCPGTGQHFAYLQQHPKLIQALTYRVVHFGMRTMQRFFTLLLTGTGSAGRGPQMMRNVTSTLERHQEALDTYYELKRQLAAALALCLPLPPLSVPRHPVVRVSLEMGQVPLFVQDSFWSQTAVFARHGAAPSLNTCLFSALSRLQQFSEAFASAVVAGVLSVGTPSAVSRASHGAVLANTTPAPALSSAPANRLSIPGSGAAVVVEPRLRPSDPYEAFWATQELQERRDIGKPPHPTFHANDAPAADRRERSWRGLPTIGSLATVSPTTSGRTSPISPLSAAPTTTSQHASWTTMPPSVTGRTSPSPQPLPIAGGERASATAPADSLRDDRTRRDGFCLGGERTGRVLLFTRDPELAWCILVLCATMLCDESRHVYEGDLVTGTDHAAMRKWKRLLNAQTAPPTEATPAWLASVQESFATAFAGQTASSVFAGLPIQWVPQEYDGARLKEELLQDPFSPYNVVLAIAPRQLLCQRVLLRKTLSSDVVVLEQTTQGMEVRSAAHPFTCTVLRTDAVEADALVDALVRESLQLHRLSGGVVGCAAVLSDMQRWLTRQSVNAVGTERLAQSVGRGQSSYASRSSLLHSDPQPVRDAAAPSRAVSPSLPRSLCRRDWLSSAASVSGPSEISEAESECVLEELLLPGSCPTVSGSATATRSSLLNAKGLCVPSRVLSGSSEALTNGGAPSGDGAATAQPLYPSWCPGTSQLQRLLCMDQSYREFETVS